LIQFFYELKITFALLHFENAQMQSIISEDGLRHHLSFYGALFVPGTHYIDVMRIRFFWWHSELKLTQWHSSLVLVWFHLRITLRQSSSAGARIDLSCGLCRLMKPVLMPTSVHLAFQWRFLAVPVCLYLSHMRNCED
ncbi:hypothetical protein T07_5369, partial [Trichinella nelsoni]